ESVGMFDAYQPWAEDYVTWAGNSAARRGSGTADRRLSFSPDCNFGDPLRNRDYGQDSLSGRCECQALSGRSHADAPQTGKEAGERSWHRFRRDASLCSRLRPELLPSGNHLRYPSGLWFSDPLRTPLGAHLHWGLDFAIRGDGAA